MADETRRFNGRQRVALYLAAQGQCSICGDRLQPGWHADHIQPYSANGATDVINGQALCPTCNERKGAFQERPMIPEFPFPLRPWQEKAVGRLSSIDLTTTKDFTVEAWPGSGKTNFALYVAHGYLNNGIVDRVVVVVPTEHLKKQWGQQAAQIGIQLDWGFKNADGGEASDYNGTVITYSAVGNNPGVQRIGCKRKTLVIFDEIHHAGDEQSWGQTMREAFSHATFRLGISGTLYRTDGRRIPFVRYENNRAVPDYYYGYADALRDDVCRSVVFPTFEGKIEWLSGFDYKSATFSDPLAKDAANERLRMALDPGGNWLEGVIGKFWERLQDIRINEQPDAGGLIAAKGQDHARAIASIVTRLTGVVPVVAISDEDDSSGEIERFGTSSHPIIVAVRMVSEGVDIPRLRCLLYATNTTTDLSFTQFIGRGLRGNSGEVCYVLMPSDPRLVAQAEDIKRVRDHELQEEQEQVQAEWEARERDAQQLRITQIISSEAIEHDVLTDGKRYEQTRLNEMRATMRTLGIPPTVDPVWLVKLLDASGAAGPTTYAAPDPVVDGGATPTLRTIKTGLRRICRRLVHKLSALTGYSHGAINSELNQWQGIPSIDQATNQQLQDRIKRLQSDIAGAQNAG
jgi:superfamily II DNA or RNA helicase